MQDTNAFDKFLGLVGSGDVAAVTAAVEGDGSLVNAQDEYGRTALIVAASKGHEEVVRFLYEVGCNNLHHQSASHGTALTAAIFAESESCIRFLLDAEGGDFDATKHPGAFNWVVATDNHIVVGSMTLVEIFVRAGAGLDTDNLEGRISIPPHMLSSLEEDAPFIPRHGSSVYDLPLVVAVQRDLYDMARELIQLGAKPDQKNSEDESALDMTEYCRAKLLMQAALTSREPSDLVNEEVSALLNPSSSALASLSLFSSSAEPAVSLPVRSDLLEAFDEMVDFNLSWLQDHPHKALLLYLIRNDERLQLAEFTYHVDTLLTEFRDMAAGAQSALVFLFCSLHPENWENPRVAKIYRPAICSFIEHSYDGDTSAVDVDIDKGACWLKEYAKQRVNAVMQCYDYGALSEEEEARFEELREEYADIPDKSVEVEEAFQQPDEVVEAKFLAREAMALLTDKAFKTAKGRSRPIAKISLVLDALQFRAEKEKELGHPLPWKKMDVEFPTRSCIYYYQHQWGESLGEVLAAYRIYKTGTAPSAPVPAH